VSPPVSLGGKALVQRFSLRSSRARPYPHSTAQVPVQPGDACLRLPVAVLPELPRGVVRLCRCSWSEAPVPGRRRLCKRETAEHDEYRLLEIMSRQFLAERDAQGPPGTYVAAGAALRELDVHFIIQPELEVVVGYAAFAHASLPGLANRTALVVVQLYVVPEHRCCGMATAALKVLLSGHRDLFACDPTQTFHRLLSRLCFARVVVMGPPVQDESATVAAGTVISSLVRYRRARQNLEEDSENMG